MVWTVVGIIGGTIVGASAAALFTSTRLQMARTVAGVAQTRASLLEVRVEAEVDHGVRERGSWATVRRLQAQFQRLLEEKIAGLERTARIRKAVIAGKDHQLGQLKGSHEFALAWRAHAAELLELVMVHSEQALFVIPGQPEAIARQNEKLKDEDPVTVAWLAAKMRQDPGYLLLTGLEEVPSGEGPKDGDETQELEAEEGD